MAIVGLRDIVYSKLTEDATAGATYGAVKPFAPAISANVNTSQNSSTQYADNGPITTVSQIGETTLGLTVDEIPMEVLADILGQTLKKGVIAFKQDVVAPYVAIGFRGTKDNGKERLVWLTKGRFSMPSDAFNTKTDSPEFQNQEVEGTFIRRKFDEVFKIVGDTDVTEFEPYAPTFFNSVFDLSTLDAPII